MAAHDDGLSPQQRRVSGDAGKLLCSVHDARRELRLFHFNFYQPAHPERSLAFRESGARPVARRHVDFTQSDAALTSCGTLASHCIALPRGTSVLCCRGQRRCNRGAAPKAGHGGRDSGGRGAQKVLHRDLGAHARPLPRRRRRRRRFRRRFRRQESGHRCGPAADTTVVQFNRRTEVL